MKKSCCDGCIAEGLMRCMSCCRYFGNKRMALTDRFKRVTTTCVGCGYYGPYLQEFCRDCRRYKGPNKFPLTLDKHTVCRTPEHDLNHRVLGLEIAVSDLKEEIKSLRLNAHLKNNPGPYRVYSVFHEHPVFFNAHLPKTIYSFAQKDDGSEFWCAGKDGKNVPCSEDVFQTLWEKWLLGNLRKGNQSEKYQENNFMIFTVTEPI